MKTLKIVMVVVLIAVAILPALVVQQAQAASAWITCWVNQTGQGGNAKYIKITDVTGTVPTTWYTISSANATAASVMQTTALTALVSGLKCDVYVTDTVPYSNVTSIYLDDK